MGKPILIIKTGNTIDSLLVRGEDFEDWFIAESKFGAENFIVKSLHLNEELDELDDIAGIIITGSAAYVTDEEAWNFTAADYLRSAFQRDIPVLGVCYGHQLIAWAFGGKVDFHPGGREIGSVSIVLSEGAMNDPFFSSLPSQFHVQVTHQQSVTLLPPNAVRLAANEFDPNQAFRLGGNVWGVQFHPEFSANVIKEYITAREVDITLEGLDPLQLLADVEDTPVSAELLYRFCRLVFDGN